MLMNPTAAREQDLADRAGQSLGMSDEAIYRTVSGLLALHHASGVLCDVGCGQGHLWATLRPRFSRCVGVDALRYDGLPADVEFRRADLDRCPLPVDDGIADATVAVEVIEHLENPRAFVRELVRVTRPGGLVIVTTPNQLSVLSILSLITKQQFAAFQENSYPAHRTALLEIDLRRIATECGLKPIRAAHTCRGRMPLTARHYPAFMSRAFPRALSDNVVLCAVRPI
jgi:2-polyprenyl-3-methyl-5-hydroxy-6-metoxy-1,4-benzoquinol methylase